jgi:hypothetical protein
MEGIARQIIMDWFRLFGRLRPNGRKR